MARKKTSAKSAKAQQSSSVLHLAKTRVQERVSDFLGLLCLAGGLFGSVAVLLNLAGALIGSGNSRLAPVATLLGPVGQQVGGGSLRALGVSAIFPAFMVVMLGVGVLAHKVSFPRTWREGAFHGGLWAVVVLSFACFAASIWGASAGGVAGSVLAAPLLRQVGSIGTAVILAAMFLATLALATGSSVSTMAAAVLAVVRWAAVILFVRVPQLIFQGLAAVGTAVTDSLVLVWQKVVALFRAIFGGIGSGFRSLGSYCSRIAASSREARREREERRARAEAEARVRQESTPALQPVAAEVRELVVEPESDEDNLMESAAEVRQAAGLIVSRQPLNNGGGAMQQLLKLREKVVPRRGVTKSYKGPALTLLERIETEHEEEGDDELRRKSRLIEKKLRDFNIDGKVTHAHPGPVITLYEFEPAPGVKVGKIAALQDDLAMGLKASSIRIIAPIPRRGTVGIEVPNRHRQSVGLRELFETDEYVRAGSDLSIVVGRGTSGEPVITDIGRMPHLLIAGATGTGKSVFINTLLLSLLYRSDPQDLGLILIDPKILELSIYEGIPHLRVPVVTVAQQVKAVFQWAVEEMDRRYRLMQRYGVRSIDGYNAVVKKEMADKPQRGHNGVPINENGHEDAPRRMLVEDDGTLTDFDEDRGPEPLAKIVIVVDELADLMLSVGRDIEDLIARLAQKARAAGIHLILATQRPSVDVVTGLIKANFPARISFRVSSRVDSRTILDSMGSEKLLGRGDMLFMMPGAEMIRRVHGAFVSDEEVKRVVDALKENDPPRYDERILAACRRALEEEASGGDGMGHPDGEEYDPVYDDAVKLVVDKGSASTSMIQRAFRIGYNRAARIIEVMERDGIVGPMDGVKPRQVLLSPEGGERRA